MHGSVADCALYGTAEAVDGSVQGLGGLDDVVRTPEVGLAEEVDVVVEVVITLESVAATDGLGFRQVVGDNEFAHDSEG